VLIENAPGAGEIAALRGRDGVRAELHLAASTPIVLYTGTFEAYQGLGLLFAAAVEVARRRADVRFLLAGGRWDQIAQARREVARLGLEQHVILAGERPAAEIPSLLDAADVLVSPRSRGTNTPLKIYQYLRSGRPIVATRLLTHTQVLNDDIAILTGATPAEFAAGILEAIGNQERAARIGARAAELAATKYSYDAYLARTQEAVGRLASTATPAVQRSVV
jgi:glycosyltransferase involved in cell wall biosynthesis